MSSPSPLQKISPLGIFSRDVQEKLLELLRNQKYYSTAIGSGKFPPFDQKDDIESHRPWLIGHMALVQAGRILWGVNCASGAILAGGLQYPHCLQIGAGAETMLDVLSGSAYCPLGSALSGWCLGKSVV